MEQINEQLVLISGESGSGKSASLRNIRNQDRWMYLNCESNKRLPFRNKFDSYPVTDPYQVYEGLDAVGAEGSRWDGVVIDTATFLMDMFESVYIVGNANTQKAWGDYAQFWKNLMQDKVARLGKPVIILAHTKTELDEAAMTMRTSVPVKGSLKNNGIEAYFSTVVSTKRTTIKELEKFGSKLLDITDEERELGFKHVFQTRLTKATTGERIRSPMGLFDKEQTYIDNCAQKLLDHLHEFYHG
jgi:hypothetical protein